jgi:aldehyde dehydrogenase (NAD+)
MGGKNPLVVLDDADLATAVNIAVNGAFFQAGQRCTASSRIIVTEGIHDRFVDAMVERIKKLVIDDALKPASTSAVRGRQAAREEPELRGDRQEGGRQTRVGGERLKRETDGFYMAPALFTETTDDMRINRRRSSGPSLRDAREELRRSAGGRERDAVRPVGRHRDDVAEATRATSSATHRAAW